MNEALKTIFDENIIGSVATVNEDGSPWVSPVHLFTDGQAVYWFSKETAQHSQNVERDPRVSVTLFSPDLSKGPKVVFVSGPAERLDVNETTEAKKLIEARIGIIPPNFVDAAAYRVKIGELNRGKSTGNCWYFYT